MVLSLGVYESRLSSIALNTSLLKFNNIYEFNHVHFDLLKSIMSRMELLPYDEDDNDKLMNDLNEYNDDKAYYIINKIAYFLTSEFHSSMIQSIGNKRQQVENTLYSKRPYLDPAMMLCNIALSKSLKLNSAIDEHIDTCTRLHNHAKKKRMRLNEYNIDSISQQDNNNNKYNDDDKSSSNNENILHRHAVSRIELDRIYAAHLLKKLEQSVEIEMKFKVTKDQINH